MNRNHPNAVLGDVTPQEFMRRYWQKKPLLVRGALSPVVPPLSRSQLFGLAAEQGVDSRLIVRDGDDWSLQHGPLPRRRLPPLSQRSWTLLVQGVDLQVDAAHELLSRFRFIPDARVDDLMVSYATDGGGVGPHIDSYDVFLLQVQGRRRWRIGRMKKPQLKPGLPLKILADFVAEDEWLLEPGDMLYLPPQWAHDGVAEGECMTCSIGFRSAPRDVLARELLQRLLDDDADGDEEAASPRYRDPEQAATHAPASVPASLQTFARDAVMRRMSDPLLIDCVLGEWLSEPKDNVWFDEGEPMATGQALWLDRRTRMLYDRHHVFINGESYRAAGKDAALMRRLADRRKLAAKDLTRSSPEAVALLNDWAQAGWLHARADDSAER